MGSGKRLWLEEEIQDDLKWNVLVSNILHQGESEFQSMELVESVPFGTILLLDGKVQSAEKDECVYHECLVHLAMLHHPNPKTVFIMGGGEGSTAREVLKHKSVEKVIMVDIDKLVCDFCKEHLQINRAAFEDPRMHLINDDAGKILRESEEQFDVIIGDLADPVYGNPCYQLYTQEFYRDVVAKKLRPGGVFVTQSGPGGVLSHKQVFSCIFNTLRSVFPSVVPFAHHVPSFCDTWSWCMAFHDHGWNYQTGSNKSNILDAQELDRRISERLDAELIFFDGATAQAVMSMNKWVRNGVNSEQSLYTLENPKFIHGEGIKSLVNEE
eukprot:TRINITY_DN6552_c0_g1_i1.p2 TRINITY_DN6552_c0_g1~~TRINITY_DN6552_c0_g1_i1.p2  ORF type:complete len:326 (-),score=52.12 TRINITY_DN6552_c0_g1_i1:126-1103(-)